MFAIPKKPFILNLGYRSQVWSPYTLLNTIDLCTSPFLLYEVRSKEQVTFWLDYRFLYQKSKKERIIFILSQFQELRTGRLFRASASSMLKEGDWSHMGNMTFHYLSMTQGTSKCIQQKVSTSKVKQILK